MEPEARPLTRRSALEVRMAILKATAGGWSRPTHIMYHSNTSWLILQRNLEALLASGFISLNEGPKPEYSITERGMSVLHNYEDLVFRTTAQAPEVRA